MEDSTLFRGAASPPVEESFSPRVETEQDTTFSDSEMPPSLYREYLRTPYIADITEAGAVYDLPDIRRFSEEADRYILAEIYSRSLPDTKESYKKIYEDAVKELSVPEGTTLHAKLEKIAELLKIKSTISGSIKALGELKQQDYTKLSDRALKSYLKNRHNIDVS